MTNGLCKICNAIETDGEPLNVFEEIDIESFLIKIYLGVVTIQSLDQTIYLKTAEKLMQGVFKGYEKNFVSLGVEFGSPDYKMLASLRENVYIFSAAKDYQQTKEISALLTKDGKLVSFRDFRKEAIKSFEKYNENYLRAEYNTAIAQARSASIWQNIEADKELFPQLEYHTVGDKRVRPEHAVLNRIVRPVEDKFWSMYMPPNGWNCRCTVLQVSDRKNTDLSNKREPTEREVPEVFRFNPGKDKIIFSPKHPYFEVAKQDRELAKQNFKLPLP